MNMIPEFLQGDATNVYRTREYIVKQSVTLHFDERYGAVLYSNDTYYRCTPTATGNMKRYLQPALISTESVSKRRCMQGAMWTD